MLTENTIKMFNSISKHYDFLNSFLSLGIDRLWRRKYVKMVLDIINVNAGFIPAPKQIPVHAPKQIPAILDVCSGTGDIVSRLRKATADAGFTPPTPEHTLASTTTVVACDFSIQMLQKGQAQNKIVNNAIAANAEQLPFKDNLFSCVTIAFGIRNIYNIENVKKFLNEANRVLQKNGHIAILELTVPENFIIRKVYSLYLNLIVTGLGGLISRKFSAYKYLSSTIKNFMTPQELAQIMKTCRFSEIEIHKLTFGMATIILGKK